MRCDTLAGLLQLKIFLHPLISKHRHAERQGIFILTNMNKSHNESCKQYNIDNYEKIKERKKAYYLSNKEEISKKQKEYRLKNSDKILDQKKEYYQNNKESRNIYTKKYLKERMCKDELFKFIGNLRACIRGTFKRGNNQFKKGAKTEDILCCTIKEFIIYIENKFTEGMSLENHGEWHLDHIIPISTAKTKEEVIKLNHYTNFQPLWALDNLKKGNKIIVSL